MPMRGEQPDVIMEDYMRLEDEGNTIVMRMCVKNGATGQTVTQYMVADYHGTKEI